MGHGGERRLAHAVHLPHLRAVFGGRGDLGLDVDRHGGGAGIAAAVAASTFSPVLSTRDSAWSCDKDRRDAGEVVFARPAFESGVPPSSAANARSSAPTSAAISLSPLFAARRCLLRRCSTLAASVITSSSSSASRSPPGSASTPPSSKARIPQVRVAFAAIRALCPRDPPPAWNPTAAQCAPARTRLHRFLGRRHGRQQVEAFVGKGSRHRPRRCIDSAPEDL